VLHRKALGLMNLRSHGLVTPPLDVIHEDAVDAMIAQLEADLAIKEARLGLPAGGLVAGELAELADEC
jgi:hypothetical protein